MSDAITSGPGEAWRPTGEVRWRRHVVSMYPYGKEVNVSYGETRITLQQRWASDAGADEWRDVPTVEG